MKYYLYSILLHGYSSSTGYVDITSSVYYLHWMLLTGVWNITSFNVYNIIFINDNLNYYLAYMNGLAWHSLHILI